MAGISLYWQVPVTYQVLSNSYMLYKIDLTKSYPTVWSYQSDLGLDLGDCRFFNSNDYFLIFFLSKFDMSIIFLINYSAKKSSQLFSRLFFGQNLTCQLVF